VQLSKYTTANHAVATGVCRQMACGCDVPSLAWCQLGNQQQTNLN